MTTATAFRTGEPLDEALTAAIHRFQPTIAGRIILPGDDQYDAARRVKSIRHVGSPALIVYALNAQDVAKTVRFAREQRLELAVRSGGHSGAGYSTVDGGIILDLAELNGFSLNPETRIARIGPAATTADFGWAAHEFGLALPTGDTKTVGLGGLVTGGGIGWLARTYGLAIDWLRSVEMVTAEGDIVRASETENPDLFWAVRGGGGNFGVVTEFEFELVPAGDVYGGALVLPAQRDVIKAYLEYGLVAPRGLTTIAFLMHAPPAPFIPEERIGEPVLLIGAVFVGSQEDGEAAMAPLRALAEPVADAIGIMPYPAIYQLTEAAEAPHGAAIRNTFMDEVPGDLIDDMLVALDRATTPFSFIQLRPLGGAMFERDVEATAFRHSDKAYFVPIIGLWFEEGPVERHRAWTEDLWEKFQPYRAGNYVNFLDEEGDARIKDAYGAKALSRLAEVKAKWDPRNQFTRNQNIKPRGA